MNQYAEIPINEVLASLPEKNDSTAAEEAILNDVKFLTAGVHAAMVRLKMTTEEYD